MCVASIKKVEPLEEKRIPRIKGPYPPPTSTALPVPVENSYRVVLSQVSQFSQLSFS